MNDPVLFAVSLAMKAGKLTSGETAVLDSVLKEKAKLVILASDASDNTKKRFHDKCAYRQIPVLEYGTRETLGHAVGKEMRSSMAVLDDHLKTLILSKVNKE